jgi:hypothetical protein
MQTVILISQIRVNSMTIVRMKSADVNGLPDQFRKFSPTGGALTSNVEQVCLHSMPFFPTPFAICC